MRQPKLNHYANDNSPIRLRATRLAPRLVKLSEPSASSGKIISDYKRKAAIAWAAPIAALMMASYSLLFGASPETLIWPAALMAGFLAWTAFLAEPQSRLRNISAMILIGAITVSLSSFLSYNGLGLMAVEIAILTSIMALLVGWVFQSPPVAMLSSLAALAYLASLFPQLGIFTGLIDGLSHIGLAIIPALLLGQAALGHRLRSHAILMVVLTAGYIWILASTKDIPLSALVGIGFALASAHYCLGKAWAVQGLFGARLHISVAAILALIGAFLVQAQWLSAETGQAIPFWAPNMFWWGAFGSSMFILFISCLMRYKASQISLVGIFVISLAAFALPLATAKPDFIYMAFEYIPGLNASPGLGLIIGAAIIAFSLILIVNGLRTGQLLNVLLGTAAIGVEALILYQPNRLSADFVVIFIVSLICALCVGGLIAGSTSKQTMHREHLA